MKSFIIAVTFLTRIPLPIHFNYGEAEMGRTAPYFPLVGGLIGLFVAAAAWLLGAIDVQLGAVTAILTGILLTGGLHLDGAMDTADGIFSARTRERMLEIMKDSHVGAHGVTAAIILLLSKFVLYQMVIQSGQVFWLIPMAFLFSRWVMVMAILSFPGAREKGLGQIFIQHGQRSDGYVAFLFTVLPIIICQSWITAIPLALAALIAWAACRSLVKILGGLTGDTYGALAELMEVVFILISVITVQLI